MANKRQIDFVTETYAPEVNGVAMTLGRLVEGLRENGHHIQLFRPRQTTDTKPQINGSLTEHLLPGMQLPMYRTLRLGFPATGRLINAWTLRRPDAVYIATEGPLGWSAVRAAAQLRIPALSGFHTNFHTYSRHYHLNFLEPLVLGYLRRLHRRTGCTLVPTQGLADALKQQRFGAVEVMQRGVDTGLFNPRRRSQALRKHWQARDAQPVCVYVGRIAAEKNILEAIDSFRAIQAQRPDARFVLVGDGPMRQALRQAHPDFIFAGMRSGADLAAHYASGDIFLFPSRTETFGNVVTEAMASGLAVLAYDQAAAGELIRDNENGALPHSDSAESYRQRAVSLSADLQHARHLGSVASRDTADLGWPAIVKRFQALIEQQIEASGS